MSRWIALLLSILSPLAAQTPSVPKTPDAAFFTQAPGTLIPMCAEEARRLSFSDRELKVAYGEILLHQGDRTEAEAVFHEATKGAEEDPRIHHWIAQAWLRQGFIKEALASYAVMVQVPLEGYYQTRKSLFANAATELVAIQADIAAGYMEQAYKLAPKDADNCLAFARAALLSDHEDLAALYFSRAVQADPKNSDVWLDITDAYAAYLLAHRTK